MKILIVRLSAIGDVIQGIPCVVALKETFPSWKIYWLVEETSASVLTNHPSLEGVFVLKRSWRKNLRSVQQLNEGFSNLRSILKAIRSERFDVAIDLQGLFKSGLWTWLSGAPRRLGHSKTRELAHFFLNEFVGDRPIFDPQYPLLKRYLEPACYLGADPTKAHYILPPIPQQVTNEVDALLKSALPNPSDKPLLAISPWSAWPSKNWPLEYWKVLVQELSKKFRVLILGLPSNHTAAESLRSQNVANLTGKTSLLMLVDIFKRCQMVIGPDSGPLHLADACNIPNVLMLFGSTSWRRSGPVGKGGRAVSLNLPCQPCFERSCPLGHWNCQKQLTPDLVLSEISKLLIERKTKEETSKL